jgi:hypothetical protein
MEATDPTSLTRMVGWMAEAPAVDPAGMSDPHPAGIGGRGPVLLDIGWRTW